MSVTASERRDARRERTKFWTDLPFVKAPATPSGTLVLSGYASTFGLDRDDEMVARDAFDKSIGVYLSKNPMVLWQHNMDWPIGTVTGAHTDDTGLYVTADVPDPGPNAADWQKGAYTAIRTGVVRTFSIGGYMLRDVKAGPDGPVFVIAEVEWFETSVVSIPANADSIFEAAVKALNGERPAMTEKARAQMEQLLGFKSLSDPELAQMDDDARRERYGLLAGMFKRIYDADPPGYDDFRRIVKAREAGADPLRVASATIMVTKAFYHPESDEAVEVKAGRAISAANKTKLQGAQGALDAIAGHLIDAAKSMENAAAAHKDATGAIKDVLGVSEDDDEDQQRAEQEGDSEEDEAPTSPSKSAGAKTLVSDLYQQLRQLGVERYGQAEMGQQYGPSVYVCDLDLDQGYVIFDVYGPDEDRLVQVPILRGADGSVALGDDETEVEQTTQYRPKSWLVDPLWREAVAKVIADGYKAAGKCPDCGAPLKDSGLTCVDSDCSWRKPPESEPGGKSPGGGGSEPERPDPKPSDAEQKELTEADVEDAELEQLLFARADGDKDLAQSVLVINAQRSGKLAGDGRIKGALTNADLPIADRDRAWDSGAAKRRVHAQAKSGEDFDPAVLKKAYLWIDNGADPKQVTSYRFIVADVVDGTLTYVPRAIFAAAAVVQGARGGTSEEVASAIKPRIAALYKKLAAKFSDETIKPPWEGS